MGLKFYLLAFSAAVLCMTSGCQLEELSDTIIVPEIEDEFYVDLWEDLSPQGRRLELRIRTIQDQDCRNYTIDYQLTRDFNRLRVSLERILEPEACEDGRAPATAEVDLGPLSSGFFDLDIALRNTFTNEGQLTVNSERYQLTMNNPAGIILVHDELRRIPNQAVWGYAHYPDPADLVLAQQFLTDLSEVTGFLPLQDGFYGYFNYKNSSNPALTLREQPPQSATLTFSHTLPSSNRQALQQLLADYRAQYGDRLELKVFTWEGEEW